MAIVDIKAVKDRDAQYKGAKHNDLACKLHALYEDAATTMTLNYLRGLGLGNPDNTQHPFEVSILRRIIDAVSVVYNTPATRTLVLNDEELTDDDPLAVATQEAFEASGYDLIWQRIDSLRNLYKTCVVEWAEDNANNSVGAILYGPHQVYRTPNPLAPHNIEMDSEILLELRSAVNAEDCVYRLWKYANGWRTWLVDGHGELLPDQPYGIDGAVPFDILPLQVVYAEAPMFRAWLPMPASRVSWCLGINASINDLAFLVQQEAHSIKVLKTDSMKVPNEIGPGTVIKTEADGGLDVLSQSPKITESVGVLDQQLRLFAISEYLPGNLFASDYAQVHTGQALRVAMHPLSMQRWRQVQMMQQQENKAWTIYSSIHNANARTWGVAPVPEMAKLRVSCSTAWQPSDIREAQDVGFKNLAAGMKSRPMLAQELFGLSRSQAIEHIERVKRDNEIWPPSEHQNAASMTDDAGPRSALGEDSASKNPDAFNPDIASNNEQGSVVGALSADYDD